MRTVAEKQFSADDSISSAKFDFAPVVHLATDQPRTINDFASARFSRRGGEQPLNLRADLGFPVVKQKPNCSDYTAEA